MLHLDKEGGEMKKVRKGDVRKRRWKHLPQELARYRHWVAWRTATENGKPKKIPVNPNTGKNASVNDPETWGSFTEATQCCRRQQLHGVGFVLSGDDPFVVVDLDGCLDPGKDELDERAWDYVEAQGSYAEVSPSGTGLHVWVRDNVPRNIRRDGVEIYCDKRFITVTGRWLSTLSPKTIGKGGAALRGLWSDSMNGGRFPGRQGNGPRGEIVNAEMQGVIDRARGGGSGDKFRRLWSGDNEGYASHSEADLALCRILALNAGCRPRLVDGLFRCSKLFRREKWDVVHTSSRKTYGQITVAKATKRAMDELKAKWAVRSAPEVVEAADSAEAEEHLIYGLIPRRSLGIVVGHSNLGKSPLLYQAGICVASGCPFLGHDVRRGRVLYLDFENGTAQATELIRKISNHLGLSQPPPEFLCWNLNAAPESGWKEGHRGLDVIRGFRPDLVILDSLTAFDPEIENRNSNATQVMLKLRRTIREVGAAVVGTHHLAKPSSRKDRIPEPLEKCKIRNWFFQARGASALINASDVRIGVEEPQQSQRVGAGEREEIALVLRGFARVKGEIPLMYVIRVFDENGEPVGYKGATGPRLLFNPEQEAAYAKLPLEFRFKDAALAYERGPQATADFLRKCIAQGILRKTGRRYRKLNPEDGPKQN
jgi:hypothetical protein